MKPFQQQQRISGQYSETGRIGTGYGEGILHAASEEVGWVSQLAGVFQLLVSILVWLLALCRQC